MTRRLIAAIATGAIALTVGVAPASASFGITAFGGSLKTPAGQPLLQAGAHPDVTTSISFATTPDENDQPSPDGNVKNIDVNLPPGLIGNPSATPKCTQVGLAGSGFAADCPAETQVGVARVTVYFSGPFTAPYAAYNLDPPPGVAAQFGVNVAGVLVFINAGVSSRDGIYSVEAVASNVSQGLALGDNSLTLWGVPAASVHDGERVPRGGFFPTEPSQATPSSAEKRPLMSNPTACSGAPLQTTAKADSWQQAGLFHEAGFDHDGEGNPLLIEGCENVPFAASIKARPTTQAADSPTGLTVDLTIPQNENPTGLRSADLKKAVVTLPAGMAVNPASASGLGACSAAQIDLGGNDAARCPDNSKIGSVAITTPLLTNPLQGSVYLAKQGENKFGSLLAMYIAVDDPSSGVVIKLPGRIQADPASGRVTASFDENPQVPFEKLHLELFGGPRASLITPPACGTYSTTAELSPWSGTAPLSTSDSFQVTSGPGGGPCPSGQFDPKLEAGTTNPIAGTHSPFVLRVNREDGTQQLGSITTTLPKGLLGKLKGVPYCPEEALAGISTTEGSGIAQLAAPSCPAASRVGSVAVGAGAGPSPLNVDTGRAYLAGPYKGAALSLAIVTPALAGPFDLGNVLVRTALRVDPATAQITAKSDPLPTILHGIPLDLREIRVNVDRPGFTLNPTSCESMQVTSTITSVGGTNATPSDRFQVADCERLGFTPKLALKLKGATERGAYPALRAVLSAKKGHANIDRVQVALPHSAFLAQEHIRTICTRVQFAADACPKASIYGYARATTPLLDQALQGPVYLRSSSNPLPDLVAALHGQIDIDLSGRIDSVNGGIRTTFQSVPDSPVSKFVLSMKGGRKGLLVNSRNLCAGVNRAMVEIDGQNGKTADQRPALGSACGKKAKRR